MLGFGNEAGSDSHHCLVILLGMNEWSARSDWRLPSVATIH